MELLKCDVLIIGAGAAGVSAAVTVGRMGSDVILASKYPVGRGGATSMTLPVGGMRVDEPAKQRKMTIAGGDNINNTEVVDAFCSRLPDLVEFIESMGFKLDVDLEKERVNFRYGQNLSQVLKTFGELGVRTVEDFVALDLVSDGSRVYGCVFLDMSTGNLVAINASTTILATGGYGRVFTTLGPASRDATGDGAAMALKAGAKLVDLEFTQFHPQTVVYPEIVRGQNIPGGYILPYGAHYRNAQMEIFMDHYDYNRAEMTRMIYEEILAGRGTPHGGVYMDCSGVKKEIIENTKYLNFITKVAGIDLLNTLIEIRPSAHFTMGGIQIDSQCRTSLEGLLACGECAGGFHGSNRLSANALPVCFAQGIIAGEVGTVYEYSSNKELNKEYKQIEDETEALLSKSGSLRASSVRSKLQNMMGEKVGAVRNEDTLKSAQEGLSDVVQDIEQVGVWQGSRIFNLDALDLIELRNMIRLSDAIVGCALARKESRGAHYRLDYPKGSEEYLGNFLVSRREGGGSEIRFKVLRSK